MRVRVGMLVVVVVAVLAQPPIAPASKGWFAGDGHVHTCYSHDAYCPGVDPAEDAETLYSSFGTVDERFAEAATKGLDFIVISDHDDIRAWRDPAFGSHGVTGVRAYEWSARGHAQMLGARRHYGEQDDAAGANAIAAALNADRGLFQANHPSYRAGTLPSSCDEAMDVTSTPLHWRYGYSVRPDTVEVWNPTALIPPGELFWECWLQRGVRMPALAGSDSHGATQPTLGMPTTWVHARDAKQASLLYGVRLGRTTLSRLPPALGGARLVLEADGNRDGKYGSMMGDVVKPGAPMRVRAEGLSVPGRVRVRANGKTLLEGALLAPGGEVKFDAPREPGWVRAVLYQQQESAAVDPFCRPPISAESPLVGCTADLAVSAMTSPLYLDGPPLAGGGSLPPGPLPSADEDEPDDDKALPPVVQSMNGAALPDVPAARAPALRGGDELDDLRLLGCSRWSSEAPRFDVRVREGRRWRAAALSTPERTLRRGPRVTAIRVRARSAHGAAGPWRMRRCA